MKTAYFRIMLQ